MQNLQVHNSHFITYSNAPFTVDILGGVDLSNVQRLVCTLRISYQNYPPYRTTFDLYSDEQTDKLLRTLCDKWSLKLLDVSKTIYDLTLKLEDYRLEQLKYKGKNPKPQFEPSETDRKKAMQMLKSKDLIKNLIQDLNTTGIIGEDENATILFLALASHRFNNPFSVLCLAKSGIGKSYILQKLADCLPFGSYSFHTQISENALYYFNSNDIQNKVLFVEDLEWTTQMLTPLSTLQTQGKLIKTRATKDKDGMLHSTTFEVIGKLCLIACAYSDKNYESLSLPFLMLHLNHSHNQDIAIMEYQKKCKAGQIKLDEVQKTQYSIANVNGTKLLKTLVTDALNNTQATYTDGGGQSVLTEQYYKNPALGNTETISTRFHYNAINQLDTVTDTMGKKTVSMYDMLGRRISVVHPASGETKFEYNLAGNLISKQTANMKTSGEKIRYYYHYNRLDSIIYPDHKENNVRYYYGTTDNVDKNLRARLILQEDGSGAQEFKYGKMGELTEVRRTLVIPNQAVATYTTKWNYDSWNRVQSMIYPDNETVNYTYDLGGNLATVKGASDYIKNITYDKFEQRKSITYGNNVTTNYEYENATRRLHNMKVQSGANAIMNNTYTYDKVGNVTQLVNSGTATNNIGGSITHNYGYDNLYRLTSANGTFAGANGKAATYTLAMQYDNLHNITYKKQNVTQTNLQFAGTLKAGYTLDYVYNRANNQQIAEIIDKSYRYEGTSPSPLGNEATLNTQTYRYDANGNMTYVGTGEKVDDNTVKVNSERKLLWDEENRLAAISDNGYVSNYIYDAAGERTVKMHGGSEGVMVNGKQAAARLGAVDFTAYVSPYLVVSPGGNYTKHIYAGSQRIASELANGMINATNEVKAGGSNGIYDTKINLIQTVLKTEYDSLGVKYGKVSSTFTGSGTNTGNLLYFYHPDHLGSSSLITGSGGDVLQHIEYVPYGEVFIEEKNASWRTPYKFNAKELDEETGLYYYGARYYDPKTSVWISVDPLAEKYPNFSSYVYCLDNPVKLIDPDGRAPGDFFKTKNQAARDFGKFYNDNSIRNNREYAATVYKTTNSKGETGYTYSVPNAGTTSGATPSSAPKGKTAVAYAHTHGAYSYGNYDDNHFSGTNSGDTNGDIPYAKYYKIDGYVATPNGSLQRYDLATGKIINVSSQMPSDANDPTKLNNVSSASTTTTYTVKKGDSLVSIAKYFGTSATAIVRDNNIKTNIKAGQTLKINN